MTTVLVTSVKFQKEQGEQLRKLAAAHRELTQWIKDHPQEAQQMVAEELAAETKSKISPELIAAAWKRIELTNEVSLEALQTFVANAQKAGFLKAVPPLDALVLKP